ncbi:MAG: hypothetical protein ACO1SX_08800 [Actinomycetota bacterium]
MINRFPMALVIIACALLGGPAGAQQAPPKRVFSQVIPSPTGRNGYEELVLACDSLAGSKLYFAVKEKLAEAPLSAKRQVLADKPVIAALRLVRQGLAKPVYSPRTDLGFDTMLPELQLFRDLARVLALQQYVFLADGRTGDAVGTARLCLRLGQVIQTDTLISGLVGIAIGTICINTLGEHLDQLNARDCEQLYRVCLEALAVPDSQARILAIEHATVRREVIALVGKVKQGDIKAVQTTLGLDEKEFAPVGLFIRSLPEVEIDRLTNDALGYIDRHHQRLQDELQKPLWQRRKSQLEIEPPNGPVASFANMLLPATDRVNDRYTQDQARLRLLACHAAILRYRWEQDRLPPDLATLRLGELAVDPFTGQPFEYHATGSRSYSLASVGPAASSDNPRAVNGREPVTVVRSQ